MTLPNITAGIAIRGKIRSYLMSEGVDFKEDKGWIESVFYLNCDKATYDKVVQVLYANLPPSDDIR